MGALARRWAGYVIALAMTAAIYIFYQEWVSFYLLLIVILFPLFSLAVSLNAMAGARLTVEVSPEELWREETGTVTLSAASGGRVVPLRILECVLRRENLLTGETKLSRPVFCSVSGGQEWQERFSASHCGMFSFRVEQLRVYDLSGLFFRRVSLPEVVVRMVRPMEAPPEPPPAFPDGKTGLGVLSRRPGNLWGEEYELRGYREGDSLRSIHWKLTAKADFPVVKEFLSPRQPRLVLSFDLWGMGDALDATFDQLVWLSRRLSEQGYAHCLRWIDPESGMPEERAIEDEKALNDCLLLLFSAPAPLKPMAEQAELPSLGQRADWYYHVLPQNRASDGEKGGELL